MAAPDQVSPGERRGDFALGGHIQRGDMAPWWNQGPHRFIFDAVGGRHVVLGLRGAASPALGAAEMQALSGLGRLVDEGLVCVFWATPDPLDRPDARGPGASIQVVPDAGGDVARAYGTGAESLWLVLDPMLRVAEAVPAGHGQSGLRTAVAAAQRMAAARPDAVAAAPAAPVLVLPDVFEEAFCRHLVDCHGRAGGGRQSGFMQEVAGRAVERHDPAWKRRRDVTLQDDALIGHVKARMARRVAPMLRRAFHFKLSRIERHLVACYAAEDGGHFGPHRDDTVRATEHRRFAVSINLNDDFEGGEVRFPEFGMRAWKAPVGAALVFSGSVLHEVRRVTRGRRYAFLPFLHDEEAEQVRLANLPFLARQG